jgi:hypothetical protein
MRSQVWSAGGLFKRQSVRDTTLSDRCAGDVQRKWLNHIFAEFRTDAKHTTETPRDQLSTVVLSDLWCGSS